MVINSNLLGDSEWPTEVGVASTEETADVQPMDPGMIFESGTHAPPDSHEELAQWMQTLAGLQGSAGAIAVLFLSDGVTNHCINFLRVFAERRTYRIAYRDSWGRAGQPGSFLQEGNNVAGVKAELADANEKIGRAHV